MNCLACIQKDADIKKLTIRLNMYTMHNENLAKRIRHMQDIIQEKQTYIELLETKIRNLRSSDET